MWSQVLLQLKESTTFQAILQEGEAIGVAKGKAEEARRMLLLMGSVLFGEPSAKVVAQLDAVADLDRLEVLLLRLLHVKSWEKLLNGNGAARPRGRKKV